MAGCNSRVPVSFFQEAGTFFVYEIGQLTGNHRAAHENGYRGFFDRPGLGKGKYEDERILEIYYKIALNEHVSLSLDYQMIDNFFYSKLFMTGLTSPPHDENRLSHPRKAGFHLVYFHGK